MKKQIHPTLLRNFEFTNYTLYNNLSRYKDINSIIFFQDLEVKDNLKIFLQNFGINIVNINILRSNDTYTIYFTYYQSFSSIGEGLQNIAIKKINSFIELFNYYKFLTFRTIYLKEFSKKIKLKRYSKLNKLKTAITFFGLKLKKKKLKNNLIKKKKIIYNFRKNIQFFQAKYFTKKLVKKNNNKLKLNSIKNSIYNKNYKDSNEKLNTNNTYKSKFNFKDQKEKLNIINSNNIYKSKFNLFEEKKKKKNLENINLKNKLIKTFVNKLKPENFKISSTKEVKKKNTDIYVPKSYLLELHNKLNKKKRIKSKIKIRKVDIFRNGFKQKKVRLTKNLYKKILIILKNKIVKKKKKKKLLKIKFLNIIKYYKFEPSFISIENLILEALHKYIGFSNINIFGKNINLYTEKFEYKYNVYINYLKLFINQDFEKESIIYKGKKFIRFIPTLYKRKIQPSITKKLIQMDEYFLVEEFLSMFPFYITKLHGTFLRKLFLLIVNPNQDTENKYLYVKEAFKYTYDFFKGKFFKAYVLYKLILNNLFKLDVLNSSGIKLIIKGRFGKVRKQIEKYVIGMFKSSTITRKLVYHKYAFTTTRGVYGYHIWFSLKGEKERKGVTPLAAEKLT